MPILKNFRAAATILAVGIAGSGTAGASIITTDWVEDNYGGVTTLAAYTWTNSSGVTVSGLQQIFELPKFDSSQGTLLEVHLKYTASSTFNLTLSSTSPNTKIVGVLGVNERMVGPDKIAWLNGTQGTSTPTESDKTYTVDSSGYLVLGTGQTFTTDPAHSTKKGAVTAQDLVAGVDDLSYYQIFGGGAFNVKYTSSNAFTGTIKDGSFVITGGATDGAAVAVQYVYDTEGKAPEPATTALLGTGLLGLGFWARRRRRA